MLWSPLFGYSVSFFIVFLNYFLRIIIMEMIKRIGYHTETRETNMIMIFVFIVQFLNTAVIITLINANTNEAGLPLGIFNGANSDFNYEWYDEIGSALVSTMLFNAYWPFIEIGMGVGMQLVYRLLDKGFSCNPYSTKTKSIQQYVNLYSGPDFLIHYKYSRILNIVFVCFMYGLALPWMFIYGLVGLIVTYIVDKILIVYYYKEPP